MDAPQIQYAKTSDGVSIAFWVIGEGLPLLFMPPFPFNHVQLEWEVPERRAFYERLAERTTLIRYDTGGTGMSELGPLDYSLEAHFRDLEAVANRAGLERFALYAYLHMGPAAIAYAVQNPDRVSHLMLFCCYANGRDYSQSPQGQAIGALAERDWETYKEMAALILSRWGSEDHVLRYTSLIQQSATADVTRAFMHAIDSYDVTGLLSEVRCPVLVLHRQGLRWPPLEIARGLASRMTNARLLMLSGSTAALHLEDADTVISAMHEFLEVADAHRVAPAGLPSGTGATIRVPSGSVHTFAAGRYTVVRQLGEGAQKTVYLVHDTALDRHCALALLKTEAMDADGIVRIKREAQAMGSLTHPNIVIVYDVGEEAGRPYIVCEYIPGGDLQQELRRAGGPVPLDRALAVGQDVCRALAAAHQRGITHRDVKPGNIWLTEDGGAKLGDFGLALAIDRSRLTMAGTAMGTAAYMAPEQAQGQATDARTDLYSLGCLLYELATGRPPFIADDPIAVVSQHIHATPLQPSHYHPGVPERLERLILNLLAKAQGERPASAGEVLHELGEIAARK